MGKIFTRSKNKEKRRFLRNHMPEPEIILWSKLQNRQQLGYRFLRQYSIGIFVTDFYCSKLKLAIEIDGSSHKGKKVELYDKEREDAIKNKDLHILRFTNDQVLYDLKNVILSIRKDIRNIEMNPTSHDNIVRLPPFESKGGKGVKGFNSIYVNDPFSFKKKQQRC